MAIEKLERDHFLIREIVNSYRDDWQRGSGQRDKERRLYFYASDVSKCDRAIFYDFICPEKKRTIADKTLMMFAAGNLLHDDLQTRMRQRKLAEMARDIEFGLEDWTHKMVGRLDTLLAVYRFIETENGIAVCEIKTHNPYQFDLEEPTDEEVDQLIWYMFRLLESVSLKQWNPLSYGFILYVDRSSTIDPLPLMAWRVDYDETRAKKIIDRFDALDKKIQAGEIPQRPFMRDSIKCTYCRYPGFCWEGIPKPETPAFVADETVEPPEQELVESMARQYVKMKTEEKRVGDEIEKAKDILVRYFKATGVERVFSDGNEIYRNVSTMTFLNREILLSNYAEKWDLIAEPKMELLKEAIKKGEIDPEIFERAKIYKYQERLIIKKAKEEKNADKKS